MANMLMGGKCAVGVACYGPTWSGEGSVFNFQHFGIRRMDGRCKTYAGAAGTHLYI